MVSEPYGSRITANKAPSSIYKPMARKSKTLLKYSCEEIEERMANGLCIFCEEQDTPGHQDLKHKGVKILVSQGGDEEEPIVTEDNGEPIVEESLVESDEFVTETVMMPGSLEDLIQIVDPAVAKEAQNKNVAEKNMSFSLGNKVEHMVGEHTLKDDRIWEPGGLPTKADQRYWPGKRYNQEDILQQVQKLHMTEFKTFGRSNSDLCEPKEVLKLVSFLNKRVWEPGGVWTDHDKGKGLEKDYDHGRMMRLMQCLSSVYWFCYKVAELPQELLYWLNVGIGRWQERCFSEYKFPALLSSSDGLKLLIISDTTELWEKKSSVSWEQVIVVVNKMDIVGYWKNRFDLFTVEDDRVLRSVFTAEDDRDLEKLGSIDSYHKACLLLQTDSELVDEDEAIRFDEPSVEISEMLTNGYGRRLGLVQRIAAGTENEDVLSCYSTGQAKDEAISLYMEAKGNVEMTQAGTKSVDVTDYLNEAQISDFVVAGLYCHYNISCEDSHKPLYMIKGYGDRGIMRLRVFGLHNISLMFFYDSLPRPPEFWTIKMKLQGLKLELKDEFSSACKILLVFVISHLLVEKRWDCGDMKSQNEAETLNKHKYMKPARVPWGSDEGSYLDGCLKLDMNQQVLMMKHQDNLVTSATFHFTRPPELSFSKTLGNNMVDRRFSRCKREEKDVISYRFTVLVVNFTTLKKYDVSPMRPTEIHVMGIMPVKVTLSHHENSLDWFPTYEKFHSPRPPEL